MTDLKIIDELLCSIKQREHLTWAELERWENITYAAMARLRRAWQSGDMPMITSGLAEYFEDQ